MIHRSWNNINEDAKVELVIVLGRYSILFTTFYVSLRSEELVIQLEDGCCLRPRRHSEIYNCSVSQQTVFLSIEA